VVTSLLIDAESGDIIVQKRSVDKGHNAGLIDKTLGGHITYGDNPDYTVMVESVQELLTPSIVVDNDSDFDKVFKLLKPYIDTTAVILRKAVRPWRLKRQVGGQTREITNIVNLYFGVYGGKMRPADGEASGMLYYSLDQLEKEIAATPAAFTNDLIDLIREYRDEIVAFQNKIRSQTE
jgi:hypothetical protein